LIKVRTNFDASRNANPYDANSVVNPYGRYGSQLSPDSIDNLMVRAAGTTTAARTILVVAGWRSLGVKTYDDETAAMTHNH
jgi:hypothetical protein